MKKIVVILSCMFLIATTYSQIKITSSGDVGIGCTPSYKFHVSGTTCTTSILTGGFTSTGTSSFTNGTYPSLIINNGSDYGKQLYPSSNNTCKLGYSGKAFKEIWSYTGTLNPSDARQKENIRDIKNALDKILNLKGVEYDLKKEYAYDDTLIKDNRIKAKQEKNRLNKLGFLAQDVNKIIPEVVVYDDSTDIYGIDYSKIVPVLVEAIKEQQARIDDLEKKIDKQVQYKSAEVTTGVDENAVQNDKPNLEQNMPNPFSDATTINFYIPANNQNASVYIYDMQGLQKKAYKITVKGKSGITIHGTELQAGMYLYTLIVDGKEVDTKRMILTN